MNNIHDPVQRHIQAIVVRDTIVPDDASDMALGPEASHKQVARHLRAMLPGVDVPWGNAVASLNDPVGRRVGRVAFNPTVRPLWTDAGWTGPGPAPHRLPHDAAGICQFIRQQTLLGGTDPEDMASDQQISDLLGFSIADHARVTDILRENGPDARLFIAVSILARACATYHKVRAKSEATGRNRAVTENAAASVEVALIAAARIAADNLLSTTPIPFGTRRIAMHLASRVDAFGRTRTLKSVVSAIQLAASAADAVHQFLVSRTVKKLPDEHDRDPQRLPERLARGNTEAESNIRALLEEIVATDAHEIYLLLMARRLDVALSRFPWLVAPHPIFRLNYSYLGAHALFAEFERLGAIARAMAERQQQDDGSTLDSKTMHPVLAIPEATSAAVERATSAGRYLGLGVYHRAVTTKFMRDKPRLLRSIAPDYAHRAYALGSRFHNLASAALDLPTHDFIRRTELDKPSQQGTKRQNLVLFYGLNIEDMIILAMRQILDRVIYHVSFENWWGAFGRTVHLILSHVAPRIAAQLAMTSSLNVAYATCKGLRNRATTLRRHFDDRDYDRPAGAFFDYALWFDRDHDIAFWDRLQRGAKLYGAFGSAFIPTHETTDREALPRRQGRSPTPADALPSRWQAIMTEAKKAFDAYLPLYLKSRPSRLTARIMARMNQGYCAFASDPQFKTIFKV
ncbi:hypothetical protein [Sphingobium yanoikuyae]|uniref:hypothetical protein n=1 Tax=Sphingobium yanoikuyae TaxID=13690 RepID=UPI002FDE6473